MILNTISLIVVIITTILGFFTKMAGDSALSIRCFFISMMICFGYIAYQFFYLNSEIRNYTFIYIFIGILLLQIPAAYKSYTQSQINQTYIRTITELDKTMLIEEKEAIKKYYNNKAVKTFIKKAENMTDSEYSSFVQEQSNMIYIYGDYYINNLQEKHPVMKVKFIKEVGIYGVNMVTGELISTEPINFTRYSNYEKYNFR